MSFSSLSQHRSRKIGPHGGKIGFAEPLFCALPQMGGHHLDERAIESLGSHIPQDAAFDSKAERRREIQEFGDGKHSCLLQYALRAKNLIGKLDARVLQHSCLAERSWAATSRMTRNCPSVRKFSPNG
jgi:hypothetical protein